MDPPSRTLAEWAGGAGLSGGQLQGQAFGLIVGGHGLQAEIGAAWQQKAQDELQYLGKHWALQSLLIRSLLTDE